MSVHMCKTLTAGCYRCDLNRDEIEAIRAEDRSDAEAAWIEYRNEQQMRRQWADTQRVSRQLRKGSFIAGFLAGRSS